MAERFSSAKQALEKLSEQLTCPICLEQYTDPKLLHCFHVFCEKCLKPVARQTPQGQVVECPNCRHPTSLTQEGVPGLQGAFLIHHLFDIQDTLKKANAHRFCENQYDDMIPLQKNASVKPAEKQLASVNKALEDLDTLRGEITSQQRTLEAQIREKIGLIHEALKVREEELISQLGQMTGQKLKNVAAQQDKLELVSTLLKSCCGFLQESLRAGSQVESFMQHTQDLESLVPKEQADIELISSQNDMIQICQQFGQLVTNSVCHAKCSAEGTGLHVAVVGEAATVTVHVVDQKERECQCPVEVSCELVSSDGSRRVRGEVKRVKDGQYDISYCPQHRGYHSLYIRVEGKEISGSPFPLSVIAATPSQIYNIRGPWGVALDNHGELTVVEHNGQSVSKFNDKRVKTSFGSGGHGPSELNAPCGVAISPTGDILVCDQLNHRINVVIFCPNGKSVKRVGIRGSGSLQFSSPHGIAVHPQSNNKIYVADTANHRVQILNEDFTFSGKFGVQGSQIGQFQGPRDISFDSAGNVYVADTGNHRIQVFTADGEYIRQFGKKGCGEGELNQPKGIAIDSNDIVYITEWSNDRTSVFTREGKFLKLISSQSEGLGRPVGITVSNSGVIYISDYMRCNVLIF